MRMMLTVFLYGFILLGRTETTPVSVQPHGEQQPMQFTLPVRKAPTATATMPPELPEGAGDVPPITFDVVTQRPNASGRSGPSTETYSRTATRIHVQSKETEWLFERNPVDPRRVSAVLVHHGRKTLVTHEESDVRNTLGISGWADVLTLGVNEQARGSLDPSHESRQVGGIAFQRYRGSTEDVRVDEVWWNARHLLPAAFTLRDGTAKVLVRIDRLTSGVDPERLRSPAARFPGYKQVDLAEWLEGRF